jgi:hypothetical protein
MDSKVDSALSQRFFNLLREHSFGADLRKRDLLQPVPSRLDDLNLDLVALSAQQPANMVRLP